MIITKVICDKCKAEVDGAGHDITIKRTGHTEMFISTTTIQLCTKCYKEFLRDYLGEEK